MERRTPATSRGFPTDCTICHSTSGVDAVVLRPLHDGLPVDGRTRHDAVFALPCQWELHHRTRRTATRATPSDYTGTNNPAHAAAGFPPTCTTATPPRRGRAQCLTTARLRSRLTGAHTTVALQSLPHQQRVRGDADRLLLLPQGGLYRDHKSEPYRRRGSRPLAPRATRRQLAGRNLQSHLVPNSASCRVVQRLPHQLERLHGFCLHQLSHPVPDRSQTLRGKGLCVEQRKLLPVSQEWR